MVWFSRKGATVAVVGTLAQVANADSTNGNGERISLSFFRFENNSTTNNALKRLLWMAILSPSTVTMSPTVSMLTTPPATCGPTILAAVSPALSRKASHPMPPAVMSG